MLFRSGNATHVAFVNRTTSRVASTSSSNREFNKFPLSEKNYLYLFALSGCKFCCYNGQRGSRVHSSEENSLGRKMIHGEGHGDAGCAMNAISCSTITSKSSAQITSQVSLDRLQGSRGNRFMWYNPHRGHRTDGG